MLGDYLTVPHRVILWPFVYRMLTESGLPVASDLDRISREGTSWFVRLEMAKQPVSLPCSTESPLSTSVSMDQARPDGLQALTADQTRTYTNAYFCNFNVLLPILDFDVFVSTTLTRLSREGYVNGDLDAVVALLVLALGEFAAEGAYEKPVSVHDGIATGFRGGDRESPPGLYLFNQARKRLGFVDSLCTLENVHIYILQATYYEANGHHLEFWKSTSAASATMHALLRSQQFDWRSQIGDMISRAYWVCLFQEELYHLELDLPRAGIHQYEDEVPLPFFGTLTPPREGHRSWKDPHLHFKTHFLAMIALRRLIVRIHTTIHERRSSLTLRMRHLLNLHAALDCRVEMPDGYGGAPVPLILEMGRQLDDWRSLLPEPLRWLDNDAHRFPNTQPSIPAGHPPACSDEDTSEEVVRYEHNIDMLTAQLRTRYYSARYILYRPIIYKALHCPEAITRDDAENCVQAIRSMCLWPSLLSPPEAKKRLVPHLYSWTQNYLGMLLIFDAIRRSESLQRICKDRVSDERIQDTAALMLDCLNDARQVDGIAEWGWKVVEPLFAGHSGGSYTGSPK